MKIKKVIVVALVLVLGLMLVACSDEGKDDNITREDAVNELNLASSARVSTEATIQNDQETASVMSFDDYIDGNKTKSSNNLNVTSYYQNDGSNVYAYSEKNGVWVRGDGEPVKHAYYYVSMENVRNIANASAEQVVAWKMFDVTVVDWAAQEVSVDGTKTYMYTFSGTARINMEKVSKLFGEMDYPSSLMNAIEALKDTVLNIKITIQGIGQTSVNLPC